MSAGARPSFGDSDAGSAVQACPLQETHWIEIELRGEDDRPIPFLEYRVKLPNGKIVRGYLDGDGFARAEQIAAAGVCQVSFPELDGEAWQLITTAGPKEAAT